MILHRTEQDETRLTLRRGTQGHTVQAVEAERDGDRVILSLSHANRGSTSVEIGPAEVRALRDWLTPVPLGHEEES